MKKNLLVQKWYGFAGLDVQNSRRGTRGQLVASLASFSCWKDWTGCSLLQVILAWMITKHVLSSAACVAVRLCGYSAEAMSVNMELTICHTSSVFCEQSICLAFIWGESTREPQRGTAGPRYGAHFLHQLAQLPYCHHLSWCWEHTITCSLCCLMPFSISYCLVLHLWPWSL